MGVVRACGEASVGRGEGECGLVRVCGCASDEATKRMIEASAAEGSMRIFSAILVWLVGILRIGWDIADWLVGIGWDIGLDIGD